MVPLDRLIDLQDRLDRLALDDDARLGQPQGVLVLGGDHHDGLAQVIDILVNQERLIMEDRPEGPDPRFGQVAGGQDRDDAGRLAGGFNIDTRQPAAGKRGAHEIDDQLIRDARQVLDVVGGPGHVPHRRLMRDRGACSGACHDNTSDAVKR